MEKQCKDRGGVSGCRCRTGCGLGACEQDSTSRIEASLSADAQAHGSGRSSLVPAQVSSSAALLKRLFTTSGNGRGTTLQRRTQRALAPLCTPDALALWHATELLLYRPVLAGVQAAESLSPLHATWAATATPSSSPLPCLPCLPSHGRCLCIIIAQRVPSTGALTGPRYGCHLIILAVPCHRWSRGCKTAIFVYTSPSSFTGAMALQASDST